MPEDQIALPAEQRTPTRTRLIDAAAEVIRTKGLAHMTTKEIARVAGFSEATLYKHFRDKEELAVFVMRECLPTGFIQSLGGLLARAGVATVRANLEEVARDAVPFYREMVPLAASLFAEPTVLGRLQDWLRESGLGPHLANHALAAYLSREQELGRLAAGVHPLSAAELLLGACFQRAFLTQFVGEHAVVASLDQFAADLVDTVLSRVES